MDIRTQRSWMYNRLLPGRKGLTNEFVQGVEYFVYMACQLPIFLAEGKFRCPCSKHKNMAYLTPDEVKLDLYRRGFLPRYWYWTSHGEFEPHLDTQCGTSKSGRPTEANEDFRTTYENLVFDAAGPEVRPHVEEPPNAEAQKFYDLLAAAQRPLWHGCTSHSELSVAVRMLSIKTEYNIPRDCFNDFIGLLKETNPDENLVLADFYRTKKLVSKLGLSAVKIDCCSNGCMLYYKDTITDTICHTCSAPRYKPISKKQRKQKDVSFSQLFYLPIIPRLQRLYASMSSAGDMTWHKDNSSSDGVLRHPSDAEAWRYFDQSYPSFAAEPRNVRLGLCADGFTP